MAPSTAADTSLEALRSLAQTTSQLLAQLEAILHADFADKTPAAAPPSSSSAPPQQPIDALALAHDAATLIRAHTTKLSLLVINQPFTPSAIVKVLRELVAGPIPGLASAAQACDAARYTAVAKQDLAYKCYRVLKELRGLVDMIPLDGNVIPADRRTAGGAGAGNKGSLAVTGVIWAACDDVILLRKLGVAGLLAKKVEEYRDTLVDVLEELKEWKEEGEAAAEEDEEDEQDEVEYVTHQLDAAQLSVQDAQDAIDDMMNTRHIPRDDPDRIGARLDSCLRRLRLTTLLYAAVVKKRLKVLPPLPPADPDSPVVRRLDEVMPLLRQLPNRFNELACRFYELEPGPIDDDMDACFFDAFAASEMLMKPWAGQQDDFTAWAEKFQANIKKPAEPEA